MQEIFKKLNRQNQAEKTEIEFETNPQNIIGASMTKEHRLVYFETEQTEPFYIDFVPHSGTVNCIFLIPTGHLLYLPYSTTNFHCIHIPNSCLNDIDKYNFLRLKYKSDKSIMYSQTIEITQTGNITKRIFSKQIIPNASSFHYIKQAEEIIMFLSNIKCCHQLSVNELLTKLSVSEKTLQRICNSIFKINPIQIIRYHLTLKIMFHIIHDKQKSYSEITSELNFRDVSTFSRYVKTLTKFSPKEIREIYNHIVL